MLLFPLAEQEKLHCNLALAHTKISVCGAAYYRNHYTRGDKQLLITRLYMPIRLSILESRFICHHICILIADERNWVLNLLAPSEGKQSRRVY